jgi:hypothetical protein
MLLRLFSADSPYKHFAELTFYQALSVSVIVGALIYLFIIIRKKRSGTNNIDYALLMLCVALFNPNAWLANFVFFIFVYMVIADYLMSSGFKDKPVLALTILSFISSSWAAESVVGDKLQNFFESFSTVTVAALILAGILLHLKFSRRMTKFQDAIIKQ